MNLKRIQSSLQNTITLINFFGKGRQEWKNSCIITRLSTKMFKTLMTIPLLHMSSCFKKTIEYQYEIFICYRCQQVLHLSFKMLMCLWDMFYPLLKHCSLLICVLNQSSSYQLLSCAFVSTFTLCIILKVNVVRI